MVHHHTLLVMCVHSWANTFQVNKWLDAHLRNSLEEAQAYTKEDVHKTNLAHWKSWRYEFSKL